MGLSYFLQSTHKVLFFMFRFTENQILCLFSKSQDELLLAFFVLIFLSLPFLTIYQAQNYD